MRILEIKEKDKKVIYAALRVVSFVLKSYDEKDFDSFIDLEMGGKKYIVHLTYGVEEVKSEN